MTKRILISISAAALVVGALALSPSAAHADGYHRGRGNYYRGHGPGRYNGAPRRGYYRAPRYYAPPVVYAQPRVYQRQPYYAPAYGYAPGYGVNYAPSFSIGYQGRYFSFYYGR